MDKMMDFFDWRMVLIDNYKKIGLDEKDVSIILVVFSLKQKGVKLITPDIISLKMTLEFSEVDSKFTNLIKRGYLLLEDENNFSISLQPLNKKLMDVFYENLKREEMSESYNKDLNQILVIFENEFGRPLSQFEVNSIKEWFEQGNSVSVIKEALNVATLAKVKTVRYIDKILLEWKRREEIAKNGHSALSDKWRKNMDETIEIAKINWMEEQ
ncbi:TPA: DnaD domain protein [bacterium]|jgi:DNA replication protein|nr:DnaD domain protein [bacterium]